MCSSITQQIWSEFMSHDMLCSCICQLSSTAWKRKPFGCRPCNGSLCISLEDVTGTLPRTWGAATCAQRPGSVAPGRGGVPACAGRTPPATHLPGGLNHTAPAHSSSALPALHACRTCEAHHYVASNCDLLTACGPCPHEISGLPTGRLQLSIDMQQEGTHQPFNRQAWGEGFKSICCFVET